MKFEQTIEDYINDDLERQPHMCIVSMFFVLRYNYFSCKTSTVDHGPPQKPLYGTLSNTDPKTRIMPVE